MPSPCYSDASVTMETAVEVSVTKSRQRPAKPLATRVVESRLVSPSDTLAVPGWQHVAARSGERDLSVRMLGTGLLKTEAGRMLAYETDEEEDDSDSVSSLPSTLAAYIREELELSQYREVLRSSSVDEQRLQRQAILVNGLSRSEHSAAELEMEEMETEDISLCLH